MALIVFDVTLMSGFCCLNSFFFYLGTVLGMGFITASLVFYHLARPKPGSFFIIVPWDEYLPLSIILCVFDVMLYFLFYNLT